MLIKILIKARGIRLWGYWFLRVGLRALIKMLRVPRIRRVRTRCPYLLVWRGQYVELS
jgi:hypothetical protein